MRRAPNVGEENGGGAYRGSGNGTLALGRLRSEREPPRDVPSPAVFSSVSPPLPQVRLGSGRRLSDKRTDSRWLVGAETTMTRESGVAITSDVEAQAIFKLVKEAMGKLKPGLPRTVTTRALARQTATVLSMLKNERESAVITHRGMPTFVLIPIEVDVLPRLFLAAGADLFDATVDQADDALEASEVVVPPSRTLSARSADRPQVR